MKGITTYPFGIFGIESAIPTLEDLPNKVDTVIGSDVWIGQHVTILPGIKVGNGIDKLHHERVFERFYRVDVGRSRASGSTGLGLAIVKHIAALYKAKITLQSGLGEGTTIQIIFPK